MRHTTIQLAASTTHRLCLGKVERPTRLELRRFRLGKYFSLIATLSNLFDLNSDALSLLFIGR